MLKFPKIEIHCKIEIVCLCWWVCLTVKMQMMVVLWLILFFGGKYCDDDYTMIKKYSWEKRFGIAVCSLLPRK